MTPTHFVSSILCGDKIVMMSSNEHFAAVLHTTRGGSRSGYGEPAIALVFRLGCVYRAYSAKYTKFCLVTFGSLCYRV